MALEKIWRREGVSSAVSLRNKKRTIVFEFTGSNLNFLRSKYQNGCAVADVHKLKRSLNEIKDRMFSLIRQSEIESPNAYGTGRLNHEEQYAIRK